MRVMSPGLQFKAFMGYSRRPNPLGADYHPIPFPRDDPVHEQLRDLFGPEWLPYFKWREMAMGLAFLALLLIMKQISKRGGYAPSLVRQLSFKTPWIHPIPSPSSFDTLLGSACIVCSELPSCFLDGWVPSNVCVIAVCHFRSCSTAPKRPALSEQAVVASDGVTF